MINPMKPAKIKKSVKYETLRFLYEKRLSEFEGWPSRTDCDAMLWAGIAKAAGVEIDLNEARSEDGKLYRRPGKDCYKKGQSRSDFSNDMLAGYILASPPDDVARYYSYLESNNFVMGDGDIGATILKPNIRATIGRIIKRDLGTRIPYLKSKKDYVRHIQMLLIYRDGLSTGFITEQEYKMLKKYNRGKDYLLSSILAKYDGDNVESINMLLKDIPSPSYVRGDRVDRYRMAHWLLSAKISLGD